MSIIRGIITKSTIWDKLLFKKLQDLLGGRIKTIITGAAPISPPVLRFLRLAFGAVVRLPILNFASVNINVCVTTTTIR